MQTAIEEENHQITRLTENLAAWTEKSNDALEQAQKDAVEYLKYQNLYEKVVEELLEQDDEFKHLEIEFNGLGWYVMQDYNPLGFLIAFSASQPLNSILTPLFHLDNFRRTDPDGSSYIDLDSHNRIASVNANGVVTDVSEGLATITARVNDTPTTDNEAFTIPLCSRSERACRS